MFQMSTPVQDHNARSQFSWKERGRISRGDAYTSYTTYTAAYSSRLTAVTSAEGATRHGEARRAPVIHAPQGGTRIRRPPVKDSFVAYHPLEVTSRPADLIANTNRVAVAGPCARHGIRAHFHPIFSFHSRIYTFLYCSLDCLWSVNNCFA